ncbi:hypothetical protein ACIQZG_11670 [Lysinibacillus sp. NPDC096418]|uniref:hypothetical protein n=1 Tax=Lysinibacillus sp. NPDC096418 TaxID=3364138 RepID=UPI0038170FF7
MDIRNKKIWFLLGLLIGILLIAFYSRPLIFFNEASEIELTSIERVLFSDTREKSYTLESEETERLITILDRIVMKKKVIPNVSAFNTDAYILFFTANAEESYTIKFDYERNIIGIIENHKNMKQYILENDSDLFVFVQSRQQK